jgi:hypothetical protein
MNDETEASESGALEVKPTGPSSSLETHSNKGTLAVLLVFAVITCGWVIRGVVSRQAPTAIEMALAAVGVCALAVKPVESADVSLQVMKVALEKFSDKASSAVVEKL